MYMERNGIKVQLQFPIDIEKLVVRELKRNMSMFLGEVDCIQAQVLIYWNTKYLFSSQNFDVTNIFIL